jgi:hypothetical protein
VTGLQPLALRADATGRGATLPACRWFTALRVLAVDGPMQVETGDEESCALLLAGTFDLAAGGTRWPSRGARSDPLGGRPVAVFLPPRCRFAVDAGRGEILLVSARQPPVAAPPAGRAALSRSPLLPLAGSGKAFDPGTGEWRPAETFATAAESLPPRRIERLAVGAATVDRVFAAGYKAATLTVDELALPAGASLRLRDLPLPDASECLLFARTAGQLTVTAGAGRASLQGEQGLLAGAPGELTLTATAAVAWAVLACAGK